MVAFLKFNTFTLACLSKKHNLAADNLKLMLSNTAFSAAAAFKADITEIAAGNGYVAGGLLTTFVSLAQVGGLAKLILTVGSWTAAGGTIGPFRYPVLYNDSAGSKELIGYYDYGSNLSIVDTTVFVPTFDAVNGVLTVQ